MMSRLNIEVKFWTDERIALCTAGLYEFLTSEGKEIPFIFCQAFVRERLQIIWWNTQNEDLTIIDIAILKRLVPIGKLIDLMIENDLLSCVSDGRYKIRGNECQLESRDKWIEQRREAGKEGAKKRWGSKKVDPNKTTHDQNQIKDSDSWRPIAKDGDRHFSPTSKQSVSILGGGEQKHEHGGTQDCEIIDEKWQKWREMARNSDTIARNSDTIARNSDTIARNGPITITNTNTNNKERMSESVVNSQCGKKLKSNKHVVDESSMSANADVLFDEELMEIADELMEDETLEEIPITNDDRLIAKEWSKHCKSNHPHIVPNIISWTNAIHKTRKYIKRTPEQMRNIVNWIWNDEFWSVNCISPLTLMNKNKSGVKKIDNILSSINSKKTRNEIRKQQDISEYEKDKAEGNVW